MERLIISLGLGFWGFVLVGVAAWLSKEGSPGGGLCCLAISAGYFSFAWSIYHDPRHFG